MLATYYRRRDELRDKKKEIRARISLMDLCKTGYHFCRSCQHVTNIDDDEHGRRDCGICGSPNVQWCEPVPGFASQGKVHC